MTEDKLNKANEIRTAMYQAEELLKKMDDGINKPESNLNIKVDTCYADMGNTCTRSVNIKGEFAEIIFRNIIAVTKEYYEKKKMEFENI